MGMILTLHDVEEAVSARFHLGQGALKGPARHRAVSHPRMIAMALSRELTNNSLPRIGRHFHRDHKTVLAACRRATALAGKNAAFRAQVESCRALLARPGPWQEKFLDEGGRG